MKWIRKSFSRKLAFAFFLFFIVPLVFTDVLLIKNFKKTFDRSSFYSKESSNQPISRIQVQNKTKDLTVLLILFSTILILLGFIIVYLLSGWFIRPVKQITLTALDIFEGLTKKKVTIQSEDEVANLGKSFNLMVERLEARSSQIQSEKQEIFAVLSTMAEQVIAVDLKAKVFLINPAACKLFSVKPEEILYKPYQEAIRYAKLTELIQNVNLTKESNFETIHLFLPEENIFEVHTLPLKNNGVCTGVLLVMHDITKIYKLEQIRRDFVANVSHELRTPLTSIQGFAETLLQGALSDKEHNREFVETIYSQVKRLTHLVNNLLDLTSIESGKRRMQFNPVSVPALLEEIKQTLVPLALGKKIQFKFYHPQDLPSILGAREELKQLFLNLLENAIKFNKEGGQVVIETKQVNDKNLIISIRDTGIGIPENEISRIFERFYRVDKARSREFGGTGLGLSIVKHIIEAHHGEIKVESKLNEGSIFSVVLPFS
ncbi:MAG: HAMP domain-containing protein [Elusimicrobia bacterium]|nr:HAMP domain-containing protein [Elusimicrobiota bacterium]